MAAVVNEDGNLRREDYEGAGPSTTNIGSGAGPGAFAEAVYQGAQSWGRKIGGTSSLRGFFVTISTIDMTVAGDNVLMWKAQIVNSFAIDPIGLRARIGSSTTVYYEYLIHDDGTLGVGEFQYPIKDAWIIMPIDVNVEAWRWDETAGLPNRTAVTEIAYAGAITITTTNENMIADAADFNDGLYLTRGDGADADGVFQDFVDDDEGTATAGRFGNYSTRDGIIYTFGKTVIGRTVGGSTANATEFTDSLRTLVYPGGFVDTGWNELEMDLTNANTLITLNNINIEGRGRDNVKFFFAAEDTDDVAEVLVFSGPYPFQTGDLLEYSNEDGITVGGLIDGRSYFVNRIDDNTMAMYAIGSSVGRANSFADTSRQALTDFGGIGLQSFRREPDTRPDITFTGAGTNAVGLMDSCVLTNCRQITLTAKADINNSVLTNCFNIAIGSGGLDGNKINGFILALGEAAVTASTLVGINNNEFTMLADESGARGGGHAVEINTTGTFGYVGNTHTGYGDGTASDAGVHDNEFDTITDVDPSGTPDLITIAGDPFVTNEAVFYNTEGGTDDIGLDNGFMYYVRRESASNYSIHKTRTSSSTGANPISLVDGSTGETHTLYSANAAIHNSSGGLVTIQVSGGGDTPSIRNSGAGSTTNVENNVAVTLTGMRDNTEIRVYAAGTTTELGGVESAVGGSSDDRSHTFSLPASVSVDIRFAHGIAADGQHYIVPDRNSILAFSWPTVTTSLPITQVVDRSFDDPV